MKKEKRLATYQCRLRGLSSEQVAALDNYARHYSHVERCLYADMRRHGKPAAAFKNSYLVKYGLTARQFNAIGRNLEGKVASVLERLPHLRDELRLSIAALEKRLGRIRSAATRHQKQRKLATKKARLAALEQQIAAGDPRICYGSRRLFRQQFDLEINGFANHEEWQAAWQAQRSSQFFVLGSGDETMGCQGCVISHETNDTFAVRLRLPGQATQYVPIAGIRFSYGHEPIAAAIRRHEARRQLASAARKQKDQEAAPVPLVPALSYRFVKDAAGWRMFVTTELPEVPRVSVTAAGALGVDINADCLALAETDRFGNLVHTAVIPLVTYGAPANRAKALIGAAVKEVVAHAAAAGKPLVIEKLDFSDKKAQLELENGRRSRLLSSFAYQAIVSGLTARAYRSGVEVVTVNPAYSSLIGLVNHARSKGVSAHQAAAYVLARRGSRFRERPMVKSVTIPTSRGDHVTFPLPARNRWKHVWSFWSALKKSAQAVLAAHARPPAGGDPAQPRAAQRKCPAFTVEPRNANRQQHCSVGVMVDVIPW